MNTLHDRLKKAFPFVGTRPVTEQDLHDYCVRRGADVVTNHAIEKGTYVHTEFDTDHIYLNSALFGHSLVYVFAHEVAHMILHVPTRSRFVRLAFTGDYLSDRNHREAEMAAALMMFPIHEIEAALLDGRSYNDERLANLIALRIDYWIRHKE